jgi:uncharacterized protein with HEPN domain
LYTQEQRESDQEHIRLILEHCYAIENALMELDNDEAEFMARTIYQKGCALDLAYIGENSKKMSLEIMNRHPEIDWDSLRRYRNFVAHGYESVNLSMLWRQLFHRVPIIRNQFEKLVSEDVGSNGLPGHRTGS